LDQLTKGQIPASMTPKDACANFCVDRPEFILFGDTNFAGRLRSLRKKVVDRNDRAKRDAQALARDRLAHPRPSQDGFGLPHWPDAEAKELLEEDVDQGNHLTMSKHALWKSKPEHCGSMPHESFVKHVHQEAKTRKFHAYVEDKRKDKIAKSALKNMPFSK